MASHPLDDTNARVRTRPLDGMPKARWDRNRPIYPTQLRRYLECPHRCRLEYIDGITYDPVWSRPMEVGNALHKVMEDIANALRQRHDPPPVASFRSKVANLLPESKYDTPDDRLEDIDNVLEWAQRGQEYITDRSATMLRIEKHYPRDLTIKGELGSVRLGAKADLVMLRRDHAGQYIEIIDYKTGYSQKWANFTPVLYRVAMHKTFLRILKVPKDPRSVFTYYWFAHEDIERIELTRDHMTYQWNELKRVLIRMMHEEDWPKQPDPKVCKHCPYFNTECFPFPQTLSIPDQPDN